MSKFPVDIISFDEKFEFEIETAINISNAIQNDFVFTKASRDLVRKFNLIHLEENDAKEFFDEAEKIKNSIAGFYPYILFLSSNPLKDEGWSNLFAVTRSESGMSLVTSDNVPDTIIPADKMTSYFVYYFARVLIKFLLVGKYNHTTPSKKGCLFDFMEQKIDILKSMRPNAICDECKKEIRHHESKLSESQFNSLDKLLTKSGQLKDEHQGNDNSKIKIFIGSSTEGLGVARKIKSGLKYDAHVDTWADGLFSEPGKAYIEILEEILNKYEYGIFVFNPDDKIFSRGKISNIPRDNVIFEYGMFLGKHTRKKAFFVIPRGIDIKIMTDVLGITCLDYDPTNPNLQSAVSDACDQIRDLIEKRKN
ncbi:MAG: nucleotide-binding protein [Candidatus Delongbacteria bacterium]|nr:nucleotide-binding protein [Candidatus Delongbacteria bacterium]